MGGGRLEEFPDVKGLAPSGIKEKTKRKLRMDISNLNLSKYRA